MALVNHTIQATGISDPQPLVIEAPIAQVEQISPFDQIMRSVAEQEDIDWRWLAAIAYQESRFNPEARSPRGAAGLMQIMGSVAKNFDVTPDQITDPRTNIEVAVKLIKRIESSLRFSSGTSEEDRMKIILACYNGGIGHILDARRLAAKHGANYNHWGSLREYVLIKGTPEFVEDETVRNGAFHGRETVSFVDKVMNKYSQYCKIYI